MQGEPLIILLVEDNDDHAELVQRSFENYIVMNKIIRVKDGEQALNYLFGKFEYEDREAYPLPNLVLLDLRLPKIDGIEILRNIKYSESLRAIPVVVLTSSEAEKDVAKAYFNHANSYLVKPLDFDNFTKLMKDLGYYWLAWNVNSPGK